MEPPQQNGPTGPRRNPTTVTAGPYRYFTGHIIHTATDQHQCHVVPISNHQVICSKRSKVCWASAKGYSI